MYVYFKFQALWNKVQLRSAGSQLFKWSSKKVFSQTSMVVITSSSFHADATMTASGILMNILDQKSMYIICLNHNSLHNWTGATTYDKPQSSPVIDWPPSFVLELYLEMWWKSSHQNWCITPTYLLAVMLVFGLNDPDFDYVTVLRLKEIAWYSKNIFGIPFLLTY